MKYYIYLLSDPITENPMYIGYTKNPKERYANHLCISKLKSIKNSWIKSLKNENLKPIMHIIDESESFYRILELEIFWIEQFKNWGFSLKNGTNGGGGKRENSMSENHRSSISKSLKKLYSERDHALKNRKWDEERKKALSENKKGKKPIGFSMLGKSHPNKKQVEAYKEGILIKTYNSMLEAATELKISVGGISNVCKGLSKTAGGFSWKITKKKLK